jgi:hypothetical protein
MSGLISERGPSSRWSLRSANSMTAFRCNGCQSWLYVTPLAQAYTSAFASVAAWLAVVLVVVVLLLGLLPARKT